MPKLLCWLLIPIMFTNVAAAVNDEELTLKNGDRLSGKIISRTDDVVVLETAYAGKLTIAASHIEKIGAASASAEAKPAEESPTVTTAAAPGPATSVVSQAAEQAAKLVEPLKPVKKLFGGDGPLYGMTRNWEGNATVGFAYSGGNSRTSTMTTGFRGVKSGHTDKLTVYGRSLWNSNRATDAAVTTQNAVWGGLRYDRNVNDRLFGFGSYDFERDRPRNLYFRSVLGGGLGHHTVKTERTELEVIAGGAWNRTWQAGPNTDTPEALFGNTFRHKFNGKLRVQQSFTVFQNITDKDEFRFLFDTTLSLDVTKRIGLHFTFGDRYNNDPQGNARRNDFIFTTGLRWAFGKKN